MPYVLRDPSGKIVAASETQRPDCAEEIPENDHELLRYLGVRPDSSVEAIRQALADSDLQMVRLVDDLIDVLIAKGVIHYTDLPPAAGEKYMRRQAARRRLQESADLIIGEKDIL